MAKGIKRNNVLPEAVQFEIFPTVSEQLKLWRICTHLINDVYNPALEECQETYAAKIRPIDEQRKAPGVDEKAIVAQRNEAFKNNRDQLTFYGQVTNFLTPRRTPGTSVYDPEFERMLRTWQEETLDSVHADQKSFFKLRKNGDLLAKPPKGRNPIHWCKIPGRSGFSVKDGNLVMSMGGIGNSLVFRIPTYQVMKLGQFPKKAQKKFELYRDESDPAQAGRWWVSIAYDTPKPESVAMTTDNTVYLALGASRMGVVSAKGEFCLNLPRPDYHWMAQGKIPQVQGRAKRCQKGSLKWKRRMAARAFMHAKRGAQQQQTQYETANKLLEGTKKQLKKQGFGKNRSYQFVLRKLAGHGCHFVITDLEVRKGKPGALADSLKPGRGGAPVGANWSGQNTGNIARFVQKLKRKAESLGGSVTELGPVALSETEQLQSDEVRKIIIARKLRDIFLAQ